MVAVYYQIREKCIRFEWMEMLWNWFQQLLATPFSVNLVALTALPRFIHSKLSMNSLPSHYTWPLGKISPFSSKLCAPHTREALPTFYFQSHGKFSLLAVSIIDR